MKRNLFTVVVVLLLVVAGIGFFRGWFVVSRPEPKAGSHQVNIKLAVDLDKMNADAAAVKENATEVTGKATDEAKDPNDQSTKGP